MTLCTGLNSHSESLTNYICCHNVCMVSLPDISRGFMSLSYLSLHVLTSTLLVVTNLLCYNCQLQLWAVGLSASLDLELVSAVVQDLSLTVAQFVCSSRRTCSDRCRLLLCVIAAHALVTISVICACFSVCLLLALLLLLLSPPAENPVYVLDVSVSSYFINDVIWSGL